MRSPILSPVAFVLILAAATFAQSERQLIQISKYQMETKEQAAKFDEMMPAAIKALNDYGVKSIGVFKLAAPDKAKEVPHMRVTLTAYKSLEQVTNQGQAFEGNYDFWEDAQNYLMAEPDEKPFKRIETVLLHAFTGMPKMKVPGSGEGKKRSAMTWPSRIRVGIATAFARKFV